VGSKSNKEFERLFVNKFQYEVWTGHTRGESVSNIAINLKAGKKKIRLTLKYLRILMMKWKPKPIEPDENLEEYDPFQLQILADMVEVQGLQAPDMPNQNIRGLDGREGT
jgi:hypothetical protein